MAFNFGNTNKGFSFGSTSTTKSTGTATPFGSGIGSGGTTGFGFGAKTTAGGLGFGSAVTTTQATGLKFGASTSSTGTGFGAGFSLGAGSSTTSASISTLTGSLTTTTTAPFKGLGGTSSATDASNQNGNGSKNNGVSQALKDQEIPAEFCKDVKQFEEFVKKQKSDSNEVARFSVRSLHKIREEVSALSYALGTVSSALHRNKAVVQRIRSDFSQELQHIEMIQATKDIPQALQHDNIAPVKFFINMVMEFEASMQMYKRQIEDLENHLNSYEQSNNLTPQDIYTALCKMQESFITLAANLHSIHNDVKNLKEQYLVYRRIVHGETNDLFIENRKKAVQEKQTKTTGLSPFNQLSNVAALAMASMVSQQQQPRQATLLPNTLTQNFDGNPLFGSTAKPTGTASLFGGAASSSGSLSAGTSSNFGGFGGFGSAAKPTLSAGLGAKTTSNNLFGSSTLNTSAGLTFGGTAAGGFELKRPPVGNKRGKK